MDAVIKNIFILKKKGTELASFFLNERSIALNDDGQGLVLLLPIILFWAKAL